MAVSDMISIRGRFWTTKCIPTGIERELLRFSMDDDQKG